MSISFCYQYSAEFTRNSRCLQYIMHGEISRNGLFYMQAEDSGILFMPVPGQKRYEGKALYNFGSATIYIDRGVAFAMNGSQWTPVSLNELMRLA